MSVRDDAAAWLNQPLTDNIEQDRYEATQHLHALLAEHEALLARMEAAEADTRRLDALEAEIMEDGPIALHNGEGPGGLHRGLGMANTGRTLRQAIDALTGGA